MQLGQIWHDETQEDSFPEEMYACHAIGVCNIDANFINQLRYIAVLVLC